MSMTFGGREPGGAGGNDHGAAPMGGSFEMTPLFQERLRLAAQIAAAGLFGFGLILWIAAHWDGISRFSRFTLVGGALAAALAVSFFTAARVPALLAAFLAAGGLFALIGQTYQTGADAWQLFAVWAAVTLPFALAARHDALWLGWSVVVLSALSLWLATYAQSFIWVTDTSLTLVAWLVSLGLAAALSPLSPLRAWFGETRWSFRLVLLLAVAMIGQSGLAGLFASRSVHGTYFLSLLVLGGIAAVLLWLPALDLVLLAVTALAIDVLLICGLGRLLLEGARADMTGQMLLLGIMSAAIVAGTGALILKVARERDAAGVGQLMAAGRTWPVILMTGIGALLASVPLIAFLGLLFGQFLTSGAGPFLFGILALAGAAALLRSSEQTAFLHQLGVIALLLGFLLVSFGLYRDARGATAMASLLLAILATGMVFAVGRTWVTGVLGAIAATFAATFIGEMVTGHVRHLPGMMSTAAWSLIVAAGAGWYVWKSLAAGRADTSPALADAEAATVLGPFHADLGRFVGGALTMGLLGLIITAGPTFLVSGLTGSFDIGVGRRGLPVDATFLRPVSALSPLLAAAGVGWLLVPRPNLQTALGLGAGLITVGLAALMPGLGAAVLLLCVAMTTGRRTLGIGAFTVALWVIGSFYYRLSWPLAEKAALLISAGLALGVLCWWSGIRRPSIGLGAGSIPAPANLARGLIAAGALAIGGLAGQSIAGNEQILSSGRKIYLALAPVDPRSLMQGDYMALNFAVPDQQRRRRAELGDEPAFGDRRYAVATLDGRGVATISRIEPAPPAKLDADEIALPMKVKGGRWTVGTDAWFFKEGTGKKWEAARFGEFRVGANGTALLVSLADKDLAAIK